MKKIVIGNKNLSDLSAENLIDIAILEGVCSPLQFWNFPSVIEFNNTMFSDTLVVYFNQKKIHENRYGKTIVFCFNFVNFYFHWHFEHDHIKTSKCSNVRMSTVKYLIDQQFDLPLY